MANLTKRTVDSLAAKATDYFLWDGELKGFGVRVSPKGKKTFLIQYRAGARLRRVKIGRFDPLTVDEARLRARELLGAVASGENPAEGIARHRRAQTLAAVAKRFIDEHVEVRLKKSTQRDYKRMINDVIIPELGTHKIVDIVRADVAALHLKYKHRPYEGNRVLSVLSKFFNTVEVWGLRPDGSNPCRHVQKYPEKRRERFLSAKELRRLSGVLTAAEALPEDAEGYETPYVVAAFRLLILTGCRLSEIQFLKWEHITKTHLMLPDSKTGARKVPLPAAARAILATVPRVPGNPFVIAGTIEGEAMNDLEKPWRRIRKKADLAGVRIHDLRHTYASNAVMGGLSIPMVGKILGHTQIQTTMRYAHLADQPVLDAAKVVSAALDRQMAPPAKRKTRKPPAAVAANRKRGGSLKLVVANG